MLEAPHGHRKQLHKEKLVLILSALALHIGSWSTTGCHSLKAPCCAMQIRFVPRVSRIVIVPLISVLRCVAVGCRVVCSEWAAPVRC